ncbi:hypothetical protein [Flavihumibacter fluvii]|uniref:hypothetical protein n=1 Tax=Flavihumibacter fluvii TaxID=2838157 RepID=UPI001BDE1F12|nr:hypothetical protein [Flavihumibacter fluvii]ULQ53305.1 hypothetical protein KJS93_03115 [Flavihumibacter fluvii]
MAYSNNSVITGKFKGSLGKELVFREWAGKTVVAKAPKARSGAPTEAQAKTQENFLLAARYAKFIVNDPAMVAGYAATLRPRQNVYSRALEDFINPPTVVSITTRGYTGAVGDTLTIRAKDDFRVVKVLVEIYAADGTLVEQGDGIQNTNGVDYTYTARQANPSLAGSTIKAIAIDVPGNEGTLEISL